MIEAHYPFASLSPAMVRRRVADLDAASLAPRGSRPRPSATDIRLFLLSFAGGFVFFSALIA